MPLSHYGTYLDGPLWDKQREIDKGKKNVDISGYFSNKDVIRIKDPNTYRTLENKLKSIGYNFNIILAESMSIPKVSNNFNYKRDYEQQIQNYMVIRGLQKENHITFVKNSSSGDLLTPWMILHNIGHAVTSKLGIQRIGDQVEDCLRKTGLFGKALKKTPVYEDEDEDEDEDYSNTTQFIDSLYSMIIFKKIFKFRSSQNEKNLLDFDEFIHELFAEYLWNGKIRTNPEYVEVGRCLESIIRSCLDSCVGKIIYDLVDPFKAY